MAVVQLRVLQVCVALGGCVPVTAGFAGAFLGQDLLSGDPSLAPSGDGHVRYLSGLLLGIGLAYWSTIPNILEKTQRFRLLTAIVFIGGLARLYGFILTPDPAPDTMLPLAMELLVTPALALWRERLSRQDLRS